MAPFVFQTERRLIGLTGRKARNLSELAAHLKEVSGSSVFFHTHRQYVTHHLDKYQHPNDFAEWVSVALQEEALAERLGAIDLLSYTSIRKLREALIRTIRSYSRTQKGKKREAPPGGEFHFCRSKSFVMASGLVARSPEEFFDLFPRVTTHSLYFHFFEARLRLERPTNDFSQWFRDSGGTETAARIEKLDPYALTLEELKQAIIRIGHSQQTT